MRGEWYKYGLGVFVVLWCVASLGLLAAQEWIGWAHVTGPMVCALGLVGAWFFFKGWRAWQPMLGWWAMVQVPQIIWDPSGSLAAQPLNWGFLMDGKSTTWLGDVPVMMTDYGLNYAGVALLVMVLGVMVCRFYPDLKPMPMPRWWTNLAGRVQKSGIKARHVGIAVFGVLVVSLGAYEWWPESSDSDVVLYIDVKPAMSAVYLGEHYLGRTPLAVTREMLAGAKTTLGDWKGVRWGVANWGECVVAWNEKGEEHFTIKPIWALSGLYKSYPTPGGERALLTTSMGYSSDWGAGKRLLASIYRRIPRQATLNFQGATRFTGQAGQMLSIPFEVRNGSDMELVGTDPKIRVRMAMFNGRWVSATPGGPVDGVGRECKLGAGYACVPSGERIAGAVNVEMPSKPGLYRMAAAYEVTPEKGKENHGWGSWEGFAVLEVK